jgi:hypothetical protein
VRAEVSAELSALVARMMSKEPASRFQEPAEVAEALAPFFKKGSVAVRGAQPDISQVGQPVAEPGGAGAVSLPPTRAAPEIAPGTAPAAADQPGAARPRSILEGLIELAETDSAADVPRPELIPRGHRSSTIAIERLSRLGARGWWAAAGVWLLGLLVTGAAVIFNGKTIKRDDELLLGRSVTLPSGNQSKPTVNLNAPVAPPTREADADDRTARSGDSQARVPARAKVGMTSPPSPTTSVSKRSDAAEKELPTVSG